MKTLAKRAKTLKANVNFVTDKRGAILRAASKVFARNGYFNSKVSDIAGEAGIADGTVYLYFKSKEEILHSFFDRAMEEFIAEGKREIADIVRADERLRRIARLHLEKLGADRDLAIVFQVELRGSTKFMQEFSAAGFAEYLDIIRKTIAEGQSQGVFRKDLNPIICSKILFGALDEMVTNWILSKNHYELAPMADTVLEVFLEAFYRNDNGIKIENNENLQSAIRQTSSFKRIPLGNNEPKTIAELFTKAVQDTPRQNALNYKKNDKWNPISSAEMISRIEHIALGLYSLGLRKGDRAALLSANSPEWTLADAGCQFSGVIDVPIYTTLAKDAVCYIINDSGARIFFLQDKETYERLDKIFPDCKTIEKLIFFNADGIEAENAISFKELEEAGEKLKTEQPELIQELKRAIEPSDVATLIYTSGTTGEPKGVMLTQDNLISNVIDADENHEFDEKDVPLSVLPLSHVFERGAMYLYIYNGMSVYYAESLDKAPDNLREVRPTIFVGVPRIFEKVYQKAKLKAAQESRLKEMIFDWAIEVAKDYAYRISHKQPVPRLLAVKHNIADRLVFSKFREFFGGRLKACITGGAALSDEIFYIFTGAGVRILQGYGLTETSPVITTNTPNNLRAGTVGKPIRNVWIRTAEDGEIEVSGPNVMIGYYNKPEATRGTFTDDGWFKTGDIGEIDGEGFLKITDRKKELFKTSGGKYIAPAPIEQMIKASRFVNQVVLVGNERKFPAALIVPNFESLDSYAKHKNLDIKTNSEFCRNPRIIDLFERQISELTQNLSKYEKVKKIALLENELTVEGGELTPTLKVKRRIVNEKYKDVIEKLYVDAEKTKA